MSQATTEKTFWMLVRKGLVQRIMLEGGRRASPIAESWEDAQLLARYLGLGKRGPAPAKIGSGDGETLEGHIALAIQDGCEVIICVDGWLADGSPTWKSLPLTD